MAKISNNAGSGGTGRKPKQPETHQMELVNDSSSSVNNYATNKTKIFRCLLSNISPNLTSYLLTILNIFIEDHA